MQASTKAGIRLGWKDGYLAWLIGSRVSKAYRPLDKILRRLEQANRAQGARHGMGRLNKPENPCVGVCKIDRDTGWCRGCWRTKTEIKQWKQLSSEARRQLLDALAKRRHLNQPTLASKKELAFPTSGPPSTPGPACTTSLSVALDSPGQVVRHRKSGRMYTELHRGALHADGTPMVIYRGQDGRVWVRPAKQFDDGRYEPVTDPALMPRVESTSRGG